MRRNAGAACAVAAMLVLTTAIGGSAAERSMSQAHRESTFDTAGTFPADLVDARCATPSVEERLRMYGLPEVGDPSDCSQFGTNPTPDYDGSVVYEIPVVTHVVMNDSCTDGVISDEMVATQIDILNEDFNAIFGSNGEEGTKSLIRFRQAQVDPDGNPTNGITRSCNSEWFADGGTYWNDLNWDPNRYMNIYTNNNPFLGYVPFLPADAGGVLVGSASDRVVVLWDSFGRDSPFFPYNLGRTGTHEIGHYLGLEHTFSGGCADPNPPTCYVSGDLICDTNSEANPVFSPCELGDSESCGTVDPSDNYMDYSNDICMNKFTLEQSRRMRCTMEHYRPDVWSINENFLTLTQAQPSDPGVANTWLVEDAEPGSEVWLLVSRTPGAVELRDCPGVTLDIDNVKVAGSFIADASGMGSVTATPPAGVDGTYFYQAVELSSCSYSNRASSEF